MSMLAPYTSDMRLGQGFNSYTQELCIDNAVLIQSSAIRPKVSDAPLPDRTPATAQASVAPPSAVPLPSLTPPGRNLNQIVTYSSRSIDNMADIIDVLNISSSLSIKYGTIKGSGSASYVNENKVNDSDLNFIVTVKVTNETPMIANEMMFQKMNGLKPEDFTTVYGDCFISGFLEGGEFSAIISIKVHDKGNLSKVKLAAEAQLAVGASPLSVGASTNVDKERESAWKDTETTISVNWSGGGDIKPPGSNWDLASVVKAANEFPRGVSDVCSRTSAILTKYTALRTFQEENARIGYKYVILDYDLCALYITDLFGSYMAYKRIWKQLVEMSKRPRAYRALEKCREVPNPIQIDPISLDLARLEVRKALVEITKENKLLVSNPAIANLKEVHGVEELRSLPYVSSAIFAQRLPRFVGLPVTDEADPSINGEPLTQSEAVEIKKYANNSSLFFSPLSGDTSSTRRAFGEFVIPGGNKDGLFCTLNFNPGQELDTLTKIRIHSHNHHFMDNGLDSHFSKECVGAISCIGFSTVRDGDATPGKDGVVNHVGRPNYELEHMSRCADLTTGAVTKVLVEYIRGKGFIAGLTLYSSGLEVAGSRKQNAVGTGKKIQQEWQTPPSEDGSWVLAGFWGHGDLVIRRLGAIWRRV